MSCKPFHMGWFLGNSFGVHGWKQSWSGSDARRWYNPSLQIEMARTLERACFDYMLMEDLVFVPDNYGASMDFYLDAGAAGAQERSAATGAAACPGNEASRHRADDLDLLLSALSAGAAVATLDLMSEGRVGCNFVTSTAARAAQNFGLDEHIDHDTRYEMADEFVDVVKKLWNSWEPDAVVMDEENGIFVDPEKVHVGRSQAAASSSRAARSTRRGRRRGSPCWCKPAARPRDRTSPRSTWTPSSPRWARWRR